MFLFLRNEYLNEKGPHGHSKSSISITGIILPYLLTTAAYASSRLRFRVPPIFGGLRFRVFVFWSGLSGLRSSFSQQTWRTSNKKALTYEKRIRNIHYRMYKPDVPSIWTANLLQLTCRRLTPQEFRKTGFSDSSSLNLFIYVLGKAGLSSSVYFLINTSNFLHSTRFKLSWWAVCFRFALPATIWFILWMGLISRNSSGFRFTVSFVYCTACVFVETKVFWDVALFPACKRWRTSAA